MPSLKKNFFYSVLLTLANYIFPLITYPYVSRVLGVTNIGVCNFVDSIVNWFLVFSTMGISVLGVREIAAARDNRGDRDRVFSSLLFLNAMTTFLAAAALLVAIFVVPSLVQYRKLLLVGVAKLIANGLFLEWLYRGIEEFQYITNRSILIKTLYVVSVFLFVRKPEDYGVYYLLLTLAVVLNALVNALYSRKFVSFSMALVQTREFVRPYFILGVSLVFTSIYTTLNVVYLGFRTSAEQVGYYTSATKILTMIMGLFTACTTVLLPRMSAVLSEGKTDEFKSYLDKTFNILFLVGIPIVILMEVAAADIIRVISGLGYEGAIIPMRTVAPLVLIIGLEQILIIQILTPMKRDRQIITNSAVGAGVAILSALLLVGPLQAEGAAVVWLFAELAVFLCALFAVFGKALDSFPWKTLLKDLLLYVPLALLLVAVHLLPFPNAFVRLGVDMVITGIYFVLLSCLVVKDPVILSVVRPLFVKGK